MAVVARRDKGGRIGKTAHESPDYVRASTAAAITLGFYPGRFYRGARLGALNLLLTYESGCYARCAYCGLSSSREPERDSFIRVDWPTFRTDEVIERTLQRGRHLQRVCISMITHPRALADLNDIAGRFRDSTNLGISGLIAPTLIRGRGPLEEMKRAGVDRIGIAIDAATPELFERLRGRGVRGPHRWERYWSVLEDSIAVFGRGMVGVHLIVGLGETEREMVEAIQRVSDLGASTHLFSFFPEAGSAMEDWPRPPLGQYRRVQLARYIIDTGLGRFERMSFNSRGQLVGFDLSGGELERVIESGEAFMTSGCPGRDGRVACNRPYGNERPSEKLRNFPFPPGKRDIRDARAQLADYD
ncbi:MAG: radical SAM protein [Thermoplasmata archaeon]